MTPAEMAALHARSFTTPRPWSEAEITELLASPLVFALTRPGAFLLGRVVAGAALLLRNLKTQAFPSFLEDGSANHYISTSTAPVSHHLCLVTVEASRRAVRRQNEQGRTILPRETGETGVRSYSRQP